ncbi:MAG: beta-lactamase family protein [Bacteroidetes bacterium]|nr:beta-lactamase family protein [Bacteroidota bacterium]MBP6314923.1 beta-lactamase family protein [Chitinophagaceae bacterium]
MKKTGYLLLLLCCANFHLSAQLDTNKLNKYFTALDKNNRAMSTVCLYQKGLYTYDRAIGMAEVSGKKRSNVYTQFRIGSISKMFTAVMILQLIEEKMLGLQTTLDVFFPTIKNSSKITIEHLLMHRSGIANFTKQESFRSYMETAKSDSELIHIFEKLPSDFEPDSKYNYSNTGYVLLSMIIEKVTKSSFGMQLMRRICFKAKLADTRVGIKINTSSNEAQSYAYVNKEWVKTTETDMSIPHGAGNIVSTAKDLCLFIEALFQGKLISEPMLQKMKTMKEGYGYGMVVMPFDGKEFYGHTGGIDNFQSILGYNPVDSTAFCILGNGMNFEINDIAIALLNAAYNYPYEIPNFEKKPLRVAELQSKEGVYENASLQMKITLFTQKNQLWAQASGQSAFELEKVSELEYKNDAAGIKLILKKETDHSIRSLTIKQGGHELQFDK